MPAFYRAAKSRASSAGVIPARQLSVQPVFAQKRTGFQIAARRSQSLPMAIGAAGSWRRLVTAHLLTYRAAPRRELKVCVVRLIRAPSPKLSRGITMKRSTAFLAAIAFFATCSAAFAMYSVADEGKWPESWPKELEPLRKQSRTLVGPLVPLRHYQIPFTKREEFETAWPYLLKVKSKGAPIILLRGPKIGFMEINPAGVLIHSPPDGTDKRTNPEEPIAGIPNGRERWMNTTYIELVVDGDIVDLNRIPLPADTPIIDERFKDDQNKQPTPGGN